MNETAGEAELIFSYFRRNQPDNAGERMAMMDRKYAKLNGGFAQLSRHIREMQADNFRVQQRETVPCAGAITSSQVPSCSWSWL